MEDMDGDVQCGAKTFPIQYGLRSSQWLVTGFLGALICATFVPWWLKIYSGWYLVVVNAGVNSVLIFSLLLMWLRPLRKNFRIISAVLKADMLLGLAAIYIGRIT